MYFGCLRRIFSANCIITSRPPALCSTDAHPITARIVSITLTGGSPGVSPKTKTKMTKPMPEMSPSPMPP